MDILKIRTTNRNIFVEKDMDFLCVVNIMDLKCIPHIIKKKNVRSPFLDIILV